MIKIIFFIISSVFFIAAAASGQPPELRQPLNQENFKKLDTYIFMYAPADSALKVVQHIAGQNLLFRGHAAARAAYIRYRKLFPELEGDFERTIKYHEELMIQSAPNDDLMGFYIDFVSEAAPSENAFIAVQRIAERYIVRKDWDSAIVIFNTFKPYFPAMKNRFDKIISILSEPSRELEPHNLGQAINTKGSEWDPTPTPDGRSLYFSADQRKGGFGGEDIWFSELIDGKWEKAKNIGSMINAEQNETVDNVSADGNSLFLSGDFRGTFGNFDIYKISRTDSGWSAPEHLPYPVNTRYTDEGACETADGTAIIFTSDRPGGTGVFHQYGSAFHGDVSGNEDIYVVIKTDSGWSQPINLGSTINTPYSERSPYFHPDGKTLYFGSDGHPGLGRLDLFKATRLRDDSWTDWSEPVNLGKEINTAESDWGYVVDVSGDSAFFAARDRRGGYGGWDIYSIKLPDEAKPQGIVSVRGNVIDLQGNPLSADIVWEDMETGKIIGRLKSNPQDGSYFIALPIGRNYGYYAEKSGCYPCSKNIDTREIKAGASIFEDIILVTIQEMEDKGTVIAINNIFFDFDDYHIKPESYPELNRLVKFLNLNPTHSVEISGHTDSVGAEIYNRTLSVERAKSVRDYLKSSGCRNNFKIKGLGFKEPIAGNETDDGRSRNRRVEIRFVGGSRKK
ncbi:MAG: hypothetical protein QG635_1784 [Bacteroidota bacterium]|nr:hypothetical protein [Bacteroidota bacterium]